MSPIESGNRMDPLLGSTRPPRVAIVILNWKRPELTAACLTSLGQTTYPAWTAIVVDNGSRDDSVAILREQFPEVTLIENGANLGFAAGNNPGIARAVQSGADYVLLLNDDTEVAPDLLQVLVGVAENDCTIGIVGPTILYAEPSTVIWSAGGRVSKLGVSSHLQVGAIDDARDESITDVDYVTGCGMLVRRQVIEQVGALDERFFMYFEETEWCARARGAGFRVVHAAAGRMWHKIRPEVRKTSFAVQYLMTRNRLLYLKCRGASSWTIALACLGVMRTVAGWSLRPKYRHMRPVAAVLTRGVVDFLRGRYGPAPIGINEKCSGR